MDAWFEDLTRISDLAAYVSKLDIVEVAFGSGHLLELYAAHRPVEKVRGLSGLGSLDTDGMIFFYPTPTYKPFTMRDTRFDLDVAWYSDTGVLLDMQSYVAFDTKPVVTAQKFSYVIEASPGMIPNTDLKLVMNNG